MSLALRAMGSIVYSVCVSLALRATRSILYSVFVSLALRTMGNIMLVIRFALRAISIVAIWSRYHVGI